MGNVLNKRRPDIFHFLHVGYIFNYYRIFHIILYLKDSEEINLAELKNQVKTYASQISSDEQYDQVLAQLKSLCLTNQPATKQDSNITSKDSATTPKTPESTSSSSAEITPKKAETSAQIPPKVQPKEDHKAAKHHHFHIGHKAKETQKVGVK
jgi:hypothetical protein